MIFYLNCEDGGRIDVSASMIDQQVTNLLQRPNIENISAAVATDPCLHQNDDSCRGAVVLAGREDEADNVQHRGEDWTKLKKFCIFQRLMNN